tara:strand:+ start:159 stop:764 length:606 start_codon:yes stop_codon:yes gene_type:complete
MPQRKGWIVDAVKYIKSPFTSEKSIKDLSSLEKKFEALNLNINKLESKRLESIKYANNEFSEFLKNIFVKIPREYDKRLQRNYIDIFLDIEFFMKLRLQIDNNTSFIIEEIYLALDTMIKYSIIHDIDLSISKIKLIDFLILNRYLFDNLISDISDLEKIEKIENLDDSDFNIKIKKLKKTIFNENYNKVQELVLLGKYES